MQDYVKLKTAELLRKFAAEVDRASDIARGKVE